MTNVPQRGAVGYRYFVGSPTGLKNETWPMRVRSPTVREGPAALAYARASDTMLRQNSIAFDLLGRYKTPYWRLNNGPV
jgi:hypothetical protein